MDFDQLATFVYVAKLKSFSRAGQKVFRSQSAVSAQIRQLEQAYHAKLLDRSAKSVELTPAGEVLFEYAEKLLRLRDESVQLVADRGNVVQGPVVFGANEATCLYLLPDIFAEFQRRFPLVHISIYRNFSHKILQRVEDGSIDVGIVTLPTKSPNLKVHHIHRDRLRFMVSTRNPLAQRSKLTLEEVASQPLIFPRGVLQRKIVIPSAANTENPGGAHPLERRHRAHGPHSNEPPLRIAPDLYGQQQYLQHDNSREQDQRFVPGRDANHWCSLAQVLTCAVFL